MVPVVLPPGCRLRYVRAVEGALQSAHAALMQALSILERVEGEAEWQAIARGLERCFVALYDANDARREPLPSLTDAMAEAAAARAVLGDRLDGSRATLAAGLDQARAALGRAHDEATQQPAGSGPADRPLRASEELPRLHTVARASLAPNIRVVGPPTPSAEAYEPLPSPTTFEELETWGARSAEHVKAHLDKVLGGPADTESTPVAPEPPSGPQRFVRTWARDCFEEIAMLGVQRRPLLDDDWRTSMELEQRMLWSLDAFVSLGSGALRSVEDLVLDAPVVDPPRVYAAGFLLGAVQGRDSLGMAERIARWAADDESIEQLGDALLVARHPHSGAMLQSWLGESDPVYRRVAARVLVALGAATVEQLHSCLADRPEVAAHALVPLALGRDPAVEERLPDALSSSHRPLRLAAWLVLALRSPALAADVLRGELGGAFADQAAPLLGAVGSRDDAALLLEHAQLSPTRITLDAVAVGGSVHAVPPLLGLLQHDEADVALAAAAALERITGAELRREVELDPEALDDIEIREPATGGFEGPMPLRELVSDSRFAPSEGSADTVELPPPDAAVWRAWWAEHREHFEPERRYRKGEPCSALVVWQELEGPTLHYEQRRRSGHELLALLGEHSGFRPDAFVVEQQQALALWRPAAERRASTAGHWAS